MRKRSSLTVLVVGAMIVVLFLSTSAAAVPEFDEEVEYDGVEGDSQAMEVTLSVTSDTISSNVEISIQDTTDAMVDYDTLDESVPGDVEIEATERGYIIEELEPGQEVEIEFVAYPRTINEEEIDVARVVLDSDEQPSADVTTITKNITEGSPWFALQRSNEEIDELENEKEELRSDLENEKEEELADLREEKDSEIADLEDQISNLRTLAYGGAILGVLGLFGAAGMGFWKRRSEAGMKQDIEYRLDQLENDLTSTISEDSAAYDDYETCRRDLERDHGIPYYKGGGTSTSTGSEGFDDSNASGDDEFDSDSGFDQDSGFDDDGSLDDDSGFDRDDGF